MALNNDLLQELRDYANGLAGVELNEANTCNQLVEPFLSVLGYDVNRGDVSAQSNAEGVGKIDYAFLTTCTNIYYEFSS